MRPDTHARQAGRPNLHQRGLTRIVYLLIAVVSLALGIVGAFLPVLPTVPFILLAAWAAGRGSPRLERWIECHPRFGAHVRAWRQRGAVPRRAKWAATAGMSFSAVLMLVLMRGWVPFAAIGGMALVLAWLWMRPEA